jgi:aspartate/methionine/tyrosine aminotransferase
LFSPWISGGFFLFVDDDVDEGDQVLVPDPCYPVLPTVRGWREPDFTICRRKKENGYLIQLNDIPKTWPTGQS